MRGVVVVVLLLSWLGLALADCTLSSTQLTGTAFEFAGYDGSCTYTTPIIKQQGVSYTGPELRVVANTTVTFTLAPNSFALYSFGLTLSNMTGGVRNFSGSALGLLGSADGSCVFPPYADRASTDNNNTIAFNTTTNSLGDFIFTQCNITWKVPQPSNTPIYYFVVGTLSSTPRRIYIDAPSVSSSSSSSSSTGSSSPSGSPSPSSGSSSTSTSTSTGTATGTGSGSRSGSSSSSSPSSGATGTSSSTAGPAPSSTSSSKPTGTSSSSTGTPNSAATARVAVTGAGVVAVMSMFAAWL